MTKVELDKLHDKLKALATRGIESGELDGTDIHEMSTLTIALLKYTDNLTDALDAIKHMAADHDDKPIQRIAESALDGTWRQ